MISFSPKKNQKFLCFYIEIHINFDGIPFCVSTQRTQIFSENIFRNGYVNKSKVSTPTKPIEIESFWFLGS